MPEWLWNASASLRPSFSWMLPGELRGFFLDRVWWAGMQVRAGRVVLNGNQNAKSETIEWDRECTGLGVRMRGARRNWIVQWRSHTT